MYKDGLLSIGVVSVLPTANQCPSSFLITKYHAIKPHVVKTNRSSNFIFFLK